MVYDILLIMRPINLFTLSFSLLEHISSCSFSFFVSGMGSGAVVTVLQLIISMYFERYRGAAYGIMFAGSTASSFVFPKLLLFLKETYTFHNSFFILAAILINMTAVSFLFRVPAWVQCVEMSEKIAVSRLSVYSISNETLQALRPKGNTSRQRGFPAVLSQVIFVLRSPMFYVLLASWVTLCYSIDVFFLTIVDFAIDKGIVLSDAVSLIPYFSVADLVGRAVLPLLAVTKWLPRNLLVKLNFLGMGMTLLILPCPSSYICLLGVCLFAAMFMGCGLTMHSVLMAHHLGQEHLAVAYGVLGAVTGPPLATKALLTGRCVLCLFEVRDLVFIILIK